MANPTAAASDPTTNFSHYQLLVEDARALGDRRETVNNLYVGVITLILGAQGYLFVNMQVGDLQATLLLVGVGVFGIILSLLWLRVLGNYKKLLDFRYNVLMEWEKSFPGDRRYYTEENATLYATRRKRRRIEFVSTYLLLPYIMLAAFGLASLARIALFLTAHIH